MGKKYDMLLEHYFTEDYKKFNVIWLVVVRLAVVRLAIVGLDYIH
jgi:hypothetical protein